MTLFSLLGIFFSGRLAETVKNFAPGLDSISTGYFIVFFLVFFILFGLSLWGAILMFYLKKGGFVLYVIPTNFILIFLVISVFSAFNAYSLILVIIDVALIVLYSTQVRYMKG